MNGSFTETSLPSIAFSSFLTRKTLNLCGNDFNYSKISYGFSPFRSLSVLNLRHCNFRGSIPACFCNLTQLMHLDLSSNILSGHIPSSLPNLEQLRCNSRNFWPTYTSFISDFSLNELTGPVPFSVGGLQNLARIYLYHYSLNGIIPSMLKSQQSKPTLQKGNTQLACKLWRKYKVGTGPWQLIGKLMEEPHAFLLFFKSTPNCRTFANYLKNFFSEAQL